MVVEYINVVITFLKSLTWIGVWNAIANYITHMGIFDYIGWASTMSFILKFFFSHKPKLLHQIGVACAYLTIVYSAYINAIPFLTKWIVVLFVHKYKWWKYHTIGDMNDDMLSVSAETYWEAVQKVSKEHGMNFNEKFAHDLAQAIGFEKKPQYSVRIMQDNG